MPLKFVPWPSKGHDGTVKRSRRGVLLLALSLFACATTASPHRNSVRHEHRPVHHRAMASPALRAGSEPVSSSTVGRPVSCRGNPAARRGVTEATLSVEGTVRSYLLSVPESYDPARGPVPLVLAYHGLTGTPSSLRAYLRVEREASGAAIFVYPAGIREVSRRHPLGVTRWDLRSNGRDVAFFDALLRHLTSAFCIDTSRVFVVGHSAGAVMANALGCARGRSIRAIASIAGMWAGRHCTDAPAVLVVHGRRDDRVAFQHGEETRDRWLAVASCAAHAAPVEGTACVRYTGCRGRATVEFCVHEGDHGVPAAMAREVWRFFSADVHP